MENDYSSYFQKGKKHRLNKSSSMPLFNSYKTSNKNRPFVNPDILKMQMMENRLKYLEKQRKEQDDQINTLMSYQMEQNRINDNNYNPNSLLLTANNILPPIGYHLTRNNKENGGGHLSQPKNFYVIHKTDKAHRRERRLNEYKKSIEELKELLEKERMKRRMSRKIRSKIYNPIKSDINYFMDKMNYNFQKKMQNDNQIMHENLNEVQNNYDEMKNLLENKMDKLELKQKMDFENLRNEILSSANNNAFEKRKMLDDIYNYDRNIYENIEEQIRNQRELDDIKYQKELDELRHKHDLEDMENKKIVEELRFKNMKNSLLSQRSQMHPIPPIMQQPPIMQYPMPFMYPMPFPSYNNTSNNNGPTDELVKLLIMKQLFGDELFPKKKKVRKRYYYFPPNYPFYPHKQYHNHSSSNSGLSFPRSKNITKLKTKKKSSSNADSKKSKKSSTEDNKKKKKKKEESEEEEEEEESESEENEEDDNKDENEEGEEGEGEGEGEEGEDEGEGDE